MNNPADANSNCAEVRGFSDSLTASQTSAPARLFLDSNIIINLQRHEMAVGPHAAKIADKLKRRNPALIDFLRRAKIAGAELFITPAVVEEVYHYTWVKSSRPLLKQHSCSDDKELRRKHGADYMAAKRRAVLSTLEALTSARKHGIVLQMPIGEERDSPKTLARKLVDAFTKLLHDVPQLGGKDALHVVTAALLECVWFVSDDGDFRFVPDKIVYCGHPASHVM